MLADARQVKNLPGRPKRDPSGSRWLAACFERYEDLGPDYYDQQRSHARQVSHLVGKLGSLGYEVTLCRHAEPGTGEAHDTTMA